MKGLLFWILAAGLVISCKGKRPEELSPQIPIFDNLGDYKLEITTHSHTVQQLFNQGLNLTYGFNHAEAGRAFAEAARLDTTCAMCFWGVAYVLGPNINASMEEGSKAKAAEAIKMAVSLSKNAAPWERTLIEATVKRYDYQKTQDRNELDKDYARAMREAFKQFPLHDDIATFLAESLMDLHPWDLYTHFGEPKEWTGEIVALLESIIRRSPRHPGANHLYIHAVEASGKPDQGLKSAETLENLVPGSGHLTHMPSHIYIRTGHYHEGSLANERAIVADSLYIVNCRAQGMYPLAYYPHNIHFLAATAALEGRGEVSINAAFRVAATTEKSLLRTPGYAGTLQHFLTIPYYVLVKFGQWEYIADMPMPEEDLIYPVAIWRYAQGMAALGQGRPDEAESQLVSIRKLAVLPEMKEIAIFELNTVDQLVEIAARMLEARILAAKGQYDPAIKLLNEAVTIEDALTYNEPPDWFFSVRHELGAILLEVDRHQKAVQIYEEDLYFYPENGWALKGLYLALQKLGEEEKAGQVRDRFEKAWKWADIKLTSSKVEPMAYHNLNPDERKFLDQLPALAVCGPLASNDTHISN